MVAPKLIFEPLISISIPSSAMAGASKVASLLLRKDEEGEGERGGRSRDGEGNVEGGVALRVYFMVVDCSRSLLNPR